MKIAHILVCHSVDPTRAIESIPHRQDALWYVFLHGSEENIANIAFDLMRFRNGNVFSYYANRGLARSWNEGIHLAMEAKCDAVYLLNDDLVFDAGRYDMLLGVIGAVKSISRNVAYITPFGRETGTSGESGKIQAQNFACCALMPECIEKIGYFDESFTPAYYEDWDYGRRAALAGMTVHVHQEPIVEHERSSTARKMSQTDHAALSEAFNRNKEYFEKKWGPDATYQTPFNISGASLKIEFADRRSGHPFRPA